MKRFGKNNKKIYFAAALLLVTVLLVVFSVGVYRSSDPDSVFWKVRVWLTSTRFDGFGMEVEKIGISVPIVKEVDGTSENVYMEKLKRGVAHYRGTGLPGEGENIVIFGHSSADVGSGPYARIFEKIDRLEKGDEIVLRYEKTDYSYIIFDKKVVAENNLSILEPTSEERLTLFTCWPIGTSDKRMVVKAVPEQPD